MAFLTDLYVQKERKNKTLYHFGGHLPPPVVEDTDKITFF